MYGIQEFPDLLLEQEELLPFLQQFLSSAVVMSKLLYFVQESSRNSNAVRLEDGTVSTRNRRISYPVKHIHSLFQINKLRLPPVGRRFSCFICANPHEYDNYHIFIDRYGIEIYDRSIIDNDYHLHKE